MELKSLWRLQGFDVGQVRPEHIADPGLDDRFWMTASVPGDVHTTLIERGVIDHPYYGHNDQKCRWIEQKEWWYRTQFDYDKTDEPGARYELTFEGLDTFATVYLNGREIGSTDNMLRGYTFDVTRVLASGRNTIAVRFDPIGLHIRDKEQFQWSSFTKERPWVRKAAMNFGWDWGPRMVTTGIWGRVRLEKKRFAKLDSVYARTLSIDGGKAVVRIEVEATAFRGCRDRHLACEVALREREGHVAVRGAFRLEDGRGALELSLANPHLWWTHDLGEPYLYRLEAKLLSGGEEIDRYETPFGIRTIELMLKDEAGRNAFAFRLNGVKLFAKGTNWIPADHFIGAIPDQRYRDLIDLAVTSNQNMLRVWAGGIYEKDVFYDECDRRGVLVWQDCCFANALYPDFNKNFMDNVRAELEYNVRRLRNRASLALWCGNNEIDWLVDMKRSGGDIDCPFWGETIYHELIPDVLERLDPGRPYWPSSPYGAEGGFDANDPNTGDRHNWQVWHGSVYPRMFGEPPLLDYSVQGVSFKNYKRDFALFSSEFGMHASANRHTLQKWIPADGFRWNSVEMAYRNKDIAHQKGILLMEGYTGVPRDIEAYMNFSMLTQAEGLKYGVEHYRRNKHRTSGALIWQHNDSWPGTSWSIIDYELLPKAAYYYARTFFHPVLLTIDHEPEAPLKLWVVNDTLGVLRGSVRLSVYDFFGALLGERAWEAEVPANAAVKIGELAEREALMGGRPERVYVRLAAGGFGAPANGYFLRDHKDLALPKVAVRAEATGAPGEVVVTAEGGLARMVKLELPAGNLRFSDNYFDLLPGEARTVRISRADGAPADLSGLTVSAVNS